MTLRYQTLYTYYIGYIFTKSILIKHESCVCVCLLPVSEATKSATVDGHEILALGQFWTNLKHDKALFSIFFYFKGGPIWSSVLINPLVVHTVHENLALCLFFGPL